MIRIVLTLVLLIGTLPAGAQGAGRPGTSAEGEIYGGELMSPQEQDAYRRKMWELRTEAEKERFRRDHHQRMRERARDLGVLLPDDPVRLDRPFFEDRPGEPLPKRRRDDGLRRWPPRDGDVRPGPSGRWPDRSRPQAEEERWPPLRRGEDEEPRPDEGLRRWPPEKRPVLRPDEGGGAQGEADRFPPGAGKVDR